MAEKAHHPRFHIGESLLPANVALFDKLGLREEVEKIGMPKWGIEFVSPDHEHRSFLEFADAWDKSMPFSWQVRRSELDELMFRHAGTCGAETIEGCRVREVSFDDEGAWVQTRLDDGSERRWRARYVIDATGRDARCRSTTVPPSTATSPAPSACRAGRKATSASSGSGTAGSGSSRWPMAPRASARSAGPTT
jgi:2-polyprenyl-6-methoxyphenol hydroxylase-like FAD-dependent oxidoreductase